MKTSIGQTLLLSLITLQITTNATKLEFDYKLDSGQAACFLEYMGVGVRGKFNQILADLKIFSLFIAIVEVSAVGQGDELELYINNPKSKRLVTLDQDIRLKHTWTAE